MIVVAFDTLPVTWRGYVGEDVPKPILAEKDVFPVINKSPPRKRLPVLDWEPATTRELEVLLAEFIPMKPKELIPETGVVVIFVKSEPSPMNFPEHVTFPVVLRVDTRVTSPRVNPPGMLTGPLKIVEQVEPIMKEFDTMRLLIDVDTA